MADLDLDVIPPLGILCRNDFSVGRHTVGVLHPFLPLFTALQIVQDEAYQHQQQAQDRDKIVANQNTAHGLYFLWNHSYTRNIL